MATVEKMARELLADYFTDTERPWTASLVRQGRNFDLTSKDAEAALARALSPPASDEESRAITALKVTLFEVECYLPSSIAKKVQAACQPASAAVVPEGWCLVPLVPTEDMVVAGFESEPDACFSPLEAWLEYEAMTGCRQAAHRAKLCYAAMLAATPSPPVGEKGEGRG